MISTRCIATVLGVLLMMTFKALASDCTHDGKDYNNGDVRPDDCNTCYCSKGNLWACTLMACEAFHQCEYKGEWYEDKESRDDGCNTCTCQKGSWSCTEMHCVSVKGECTHGGKGYKIGDTRPDDCNTCRCSRGGLWSCTIMACEAFYQCENKGKWYEDKETRPSDDGCNTCTCRKGSWSCTEMYCLDDGGQTKTIGCTGYDGTKRTEGEEWGCYIGNVRSCKCENGRVACATPSCIGPPKCDKFDTSQCCPTCLEEHPDCERPCPRNLDEKCASDGEVYGNQCLFDIAKCKNEELDMIPCDP